MPCSIFKDYVIILIEIELSLGTTWMFEQYGKVGCLTRYEYTYEKYWEEIKETKRVRRNCFILLME